MSKEPKHKAPPPERLPAQRETVEEATDRLMVVAEAKLLVRQLDEYLLLLGDWALEEGAEDATY